MKEFIKNLLFSLVLFGIVSFSVLFYLNRGVGWRYALFKSLKTVNIDTSYEYTDEEEALIQKGLDSGVMCFDEDIGKEARFETCYIYYNFPENVRKAFEEGGGNVLVTHRDEEMGEREDSSGVFYYKPKSKKYGIKLFVNDLADLNNRKEVFTHEMGHFVDRKLDKISKNNTNWVNICNKKGFGKYMRVNFHDDIYSEGFAEISSLEGIEKFFFNIEFPGAYDFVWEQWGKI